MILKNNYNSKIIYLSIIVIIKELVLFTKILFIQHFKILNIIKVPLCQIKYENRFNLNTNYNNSLELIDYFKNRLLKTDSDIYLIGAGLYSNLLCDFIKMTMGKISINCGSSIQLFFGLSGNRFMYLEEQKVTNKYWKYPDLLKCDKFTDKINMGGYLTDGIQAYSKYKRQI